jgi:hypothetical protein
VLPKDTEVELVEDDTSKLLAAEFSARSVESMHRLHHLQSLGLSCTADQLQQAQSVIRSEFTGDTARSRCPLRALRLAVDTRDASNADWKLALPLRSATIREELKAVRVLEIAFREENLLHHPALDQFAAELPPSQPGFATRKLTFLWALRTWRPECAGLDAYVVAIIFGYCGPNVKLPYRGVLLTWIYHWMCTTKCSNGQRFLRAAPS